MTGQVDSDPVFCGADWIKSGKIDPPATRKGVIDIYRNIEPMQFIVEYQSKYREYGTHGLGTPYSCIHMG